MNGDYDRHLEYQRYMHEEHDQEADDLAREEAEERALDDLMDVERESGRNDC